MKENCIFCKIISGDIPSRKIYEDEDFMVILDVNPATKGHALILPKNHYSDLFEMPKDLLEKILLLAQKVGLVMKKELACDGLNLLQNNGEVAGQTVHHFHLHLIPRYESEKNKDILKWEPENLSAEEFDLIASKIQQGL